MSVRTRKVAVITGPISVGTTQRLLQSGYALVVNYARSAAEATALADSLRASDAGALAVQIDGTPVCEPGAEKAA